jgi:hypothetical protein
MYSLLNKPQIRMPESSAIHIEDNDSFTCFNCTNSKVLIQATIAINIAITVTATVGVYLLWNTDCGK